MAAVKKYSKLDVLKIVDSCFNMYASNYRTEAKECSIEIMKGMDNKNIVQTPDITEGSGDQVSLYEMII
jgi:hypothetical protein